MAILTALGLLAAWALGTTQLPLPERDRPRPELRDERGELVEQWLFHVDVATGLQQGEICLVKPPPDWDIRVVWLAAFCQRSPRIHIDGNDGLITSISVDAGPSIPEECEFTGLWHAVDLKTAKPVAPDVTLDVYGPYQRTK